MPDAAPRGEGLGFHPFADIFPLIEGADLAALVEDIRVNGVRDPIFLLDGLILDGRNRYRALRALRASGEARGPGWGVYEGRPIEDEDLDPAIVLWPFEKYSPADDGDPLHFVISKNLHRRHLDDRQRSSIGGKIANLTRGGDRSKPPIGGLSTLQVAELLNVATRQVERARVVHEQGIEDLRSALDRGDVAVSVAEEIARKPADDQRVEIIRRGIAPVNGARSVMASRQEPDDSLDFFPTPPWATRALVEYVLPRLGIRDLGQAWEPACGEGHIAGVLEEYASVVASDIHDYSDQERMPPSWWRVLDFLDPRETTPVVDWIITNPPFGERTEAFAMRALDLARIGVAMFVRLQWLETIGRYERLFRDRPPTLISFFCERVNLCKGRWDPDGSTATAYIWCVWLKGEAARAPYWIPPGCRDGLSREGDRERFTAHPVAKGAGRLAHILPAHDPETGEIIESEAATSTAGIGSLHRPATENASAEEPSNPDGSGEAQDRGVSASPPHCRSAEADHGLTSGEKPPAEGAAPELTPVSAGAVPHSNVIPKPVEIPAFAEDAPPAAQEDDGLDIPYFLKRKEGVAPGYGGAGR